MLTKWNYLSECVQFCETGRKVIISTTDEGVVSTNKNDMSDVKYLQPCTHDEADTILLHFDRCARQYIDFVKWQSEP